MPAKPGRLLALAAVPLLAALGFGVSQLGSAEAAPTTAARTAPVNAPPSSAPAPGPPPAAPTASALPAR
ncbi:MAG: hypothetical protein HOY69_12140, partial [Streptomyces sp.]|nr:hypothetical protein [Streptomyces sp.]